MKPLALLGLAGLAAAHEHEELKHGLEVVHDTHRMTFEGGFVHECIHDHIMKNATAPSTVQVNYTTSKRSAKPLQRQKMRIKWFWGEECSPARGNPDQSCYCKYSGETVPTFQNSVQGCNQEQVLTTARKQYLDQIVADAAEWLSTALQVDPVSGTLKTGDKVENGYYNKQATPYCGGSSWNDNGIKTMASHHTTGVADADFLVYVSAVPTQGNTLAWALTCMADQNGRPIAAHVNFGPTRVDETVPTNTVSYKNYVATAVHEIMHALGFSSSNWRGKANWFPEHCGGSGGCLPSITVSERGQSSVTKINTPNVLKTIREYSGCSSLNGAEIENEGGSGTGGSHWEKRVFGNEGMTGVSGTHEAAWSKMTLAFFADMGWYDVDYSVVGEEFSWGKGKGCSFWTDKCNEISPSSAASPEFCFPDDPNVDLNGCDFNLMGTGRCDVNRYGSNLPSEFQYFSQGGNYGGSQNGLTDFCPTMKTYSNTECTDPADARTGSINDASLGSVRHADSRCFPANTLSSSMRWTVPGMSKFRCMKVTCASDCSSYDVHVGDDKVTCGASGQPQYPSGFSNRWRDAEGKGAAYVKCWPLEEMCGPRSRSKLGRSCGNAPQPTPVPIPQTPAPPPPTPEPTCAPCRAKSQCHKVGVCDKSTMTCTNPTKADGWPCDDGVRGTYNDQCQQGACVGHEACLGTDCTAQDTQCHVSTCDLDTHKCKESPRQDGTPCDDGNSRTSNDMCTGGVCAGTYPSPPPPSPSPPPPSPPPPKPTCAPCQAASQCHDVGVCDFSSLKCTEPTKQDGASCDDGDADTFNDQCKKGMCQGHAACFGVDCGTDVPCMKSSCNQQTHKCEEAPVADGQQCDDGDFTTLGDRCQGGKCVGTARSPPPPSPPPPSPSPPPPSPPPPSPSPPPPTCAPCTVKSQCHSMGVCDPATLKCTNPLKKDGEPCDDRNPDTSDDACQNGICAGHAACFGKDCTTTKACMTSGCNQATHACEERPMQDGLPCDDGDDSTHDDECYGGQCVGTRSSPPPPSPPPPSPPPPPKPTCAPCKAKSQCHRVGKCNEDTIECSNPFKAQGTPCDDGDASTFNDECDMGACTGHQACFGQICAPGDPQCHVSECDTATHQCVERAKKDGTQCDDDNDMTVDDKCTSGRCHGTMRMSPPPPQRIPPPPSPPIKTPVDPSAGAGKDASQCIAKAPPPDPAAAQVRGAHVPSKNDFAIEATTGERLTLALAYTIALLFLIFWTAWLLSCLRNPGQDDDNWLLPPPLGFVDTTGRRHRYVPPPAEAPRRPAPGPRLRAPQAPQAPYDWCGHARRQEERLLEAVDDIRNARVQAAQKEFEIAALHVVLRRERLEHRETRRALHSTNNQLECTIRALEDLMQDLDRPVGAAAAAAPPPGADGAAMGDLVYSSVNGTPPPVRAAAAAAPPPDVDEAMPVRAAAAAAPPPNADGALPDVDRMYIS